jgi:hypothetical protein
MSMANELIPELDKCIEWTQEREQILRKHINNLEKQQCTGKGLKTIKYEHQYYHSILKHLKNHKNGITNN